SRGFFRVSRQQLNDFADGRASAVVSTDFTGLDVVKSADKYMQQFSGCKTLDGRIWFPTALGLAMIDPTNLTMHPVLPRVHLQGVRANGRDLDNLAGAVVRPGIGDLQFQFAGLSFTAPQKIRYRYKLEGHDLEWVEAGTRRAAFYTNLKPGTYLFQVQARSEGGAWNQRGAECAIQLLPHYYQTRWFAAAVIAVLGTGVFGLIGWRVRSFRRKQRQLQQARDLLEVKVKERTSELAQAN